VRAKIFARLAHYPSLAWNVAICRVFRLWNWWDQVDALLFVGARPFRSDVRRLYDLGIRAVVNTCEEYAGPINAYSNFGIKQLHLPTIDFLSPSLEDVRTGVKFIEDSHNKGQPVYVHCKAGRGRSATIALCWLMYTHKINPVDAFKQLKEKRKQVSKNLAQRPVVQLYWDSISNTQS
jgi:atypical dual specificity phosphatase